MATTKLTNHIRESILKDLLAFAFLERAQAQIYAECDFSTAKATLASVSTISKLIDVGPEARVFAEKYAVQGEAKAILPAIPRRELNNALGLPPASEFRVAGGEVVA